MRLRHLDILARLTIGALLTVPASAPPALAQQPTQAQIEAALRGPGAAESVRQRLRDSGLTTEQVRARLRASGYSAALLDAYMGEEQSGAAQRDLVLTEQQAEAIRVLGIPEAVPETAPMAVGDMPTTPSGRASDVFGVDVFRRSTTQFLPLLSGPTPADYRLGPGDVLVLILTGDVEAAHQLSITRDGFVLIPQIGQLYLSNLTMEQARSLMYERLSRAYSGLRRGAGGTTHFELSVASVRAIQVFVIGEVTQPGAYQMSALGTALTALYTAGGVTDQANMRAVSIRRGGRAVASFDLYDYLLKGDTRQDIRLENGDVVFVGLRERRVRVGGAVRRRAWYDVSPTETLRDILAAAGGLSAEGSVSRITIDRVLPPAQRSERGPQRVVIDVPVTPRDSFVVPPMRLEDDDRVTLYSLDSTTTGFVEIGGSVFIPGRVGLHQGMRLSDLLERAGGVRKGTFSGRVHISRLKEPDQTRQLISVALPSDSGGAMSDDPLLQAEDIVTVYSVLAQRVAREVAISGAVNRAVRVPYVDGMTVRDLILKADGLAPGASLDSVEIARLPERRTEGSLAVTVRAPIDSTYLFDRDSLGRYLGPPGQQFRASGTPEIELRPWDNVVVLRQPGWEFQRTVAIMGQVRFPGRYALESRTDRLADLLRRAGGLAPAAYPTGTEFWRSFDRRGRVGIDLDAAQRDPRSPSNMILMEGDSVYVPEYVPLVQVGGAVQSPSAVLYVTGRKLDDYIDAGGGTTREADLAHTYVIQPTGQIESVRRRFLLPDRLPVPQAGAVVVVPSKDPEDRKELLSLIGSVVQIVSAAITLVVVVTR